MNFAFSSLVSSFYLTGTTFAHSYLVFQSFLSATSLASPLYLACYSSFVFLSLSSLVLYSCRYHSSLVPGAAVSRLPLNSLIARPFVIRTLLVPRLYAVRTPLVPRSRRVRISLTSLVLHRTLLVSHSHLPRILFVPRSYLTRFSVPTNYSRT